MHLIFCKAVWNLLDDDTERAMPHGNFADFFDTGEDDGDLDLDRRFSF